MAEGLTRLDSTAFGFLCAIPVVATILFGAVDNITWALITIMLSMVILLWGADSIRKNGFVVGLSEIQIPLAVLIIIGLIQLLPLGSPLPAELGIDAKHTISQAPYSTRFFLRNLVVFLVFLTACLTFINSSARMKKVVHLVIFFGAAVAFFGILQNLARADLIYGLRITSGAVIFGPFVNEHHFAAFMEMTGGLTLGLILGGSTREKKAVLGMGLVIMLSAMILTSSRGAMLSLVATTVFAGALTYYYHSRRKGEAAEVDDEEIQQSPVPMMLGALGMLLVVVGVVLYLGGDESLARGIGLGYAGSEDVSNGRLHFWSVGLQIFFAHPLIGVGFGAFAEAFTKYDTWNGLYRIENAHNDYVQMLAEGGVLALVCIIAFIVLVLRSALRRIAATSPGFRRDAAIGALSGCVGIMVHSFFDFPLRTWSNTFFMLMLVAIATVYIPSDEVVGEKRTKRRRSTAR